MKKFVKSFVYAYRGIRCSLEGRNMRVHLVIAWLALIAGLYFRITRLEWVIVFFCMAMVLSAEAFNSAIENLSDVVRDDLGATYHRMGPCRDLAAGAVLIIAIFAGIIGVLVFAPYFFTLFA